MLGIQAKVPLLIEKHGWPGKSHIFKVYSYHSWFGVAIATEGLRVGEGRAQEISGSGELIDRSPEHCLDTSVLGDR